MQFHKNKFKKGSFDYLLIMVRIFLIELVWTFSNFLHLHNRAKILMKSHEDRYIFPFSKHEINLTLKMFEKDILKSFKTIK